jgi:hypothetical protein
MAIPYNHRTDHNIYSFVVRQKSCRSPLTVRIYYITESNLSGIFLAVRGQIRSAFCEHCGALIADNAYRVTSEEVGIILSGGEKPSTFHAEEINVRSKQTSPRH